MVDLEQLLPYGSRQQTRVKRVQHGTRAFQRSQSGRGSSLALYTFALLWPPVRVRLLFLFGRDTALAPPRSDCGGRGIFAIFASVLTCPADGPDTIIDTFDLGAPAASAGNAGAHPAWGLRGRRPSSSALQASRRYGRGVGGPKTGWKIRVLQQSRRAERVRALGGGRAVDGRQGVR